jgi:hypothetical protein
MCMQQRYKGQIAHSSIEICKISSQALLWGGVKTDFISIKGRIFLRVVEKMMFWGCIDENRVLD